MLRKTRTKKYREKTNLDILQKLDNYFLDKKETFRHDYVYINLSKLNCFDIHFLEYNYNSDIIISFVESITKNPNFKIEWLEHPIIKEYKYCCWEEIKNHNNFKIEWVDTYPDKPWEWDKIGKHPNFQIEWIEKYPDKEWNYWNDISSSPNFKIEWVDKYPDKKWNWDYIIQSKNITLEFVKNNPNYPWRYPSLIYNPQFNIDWIEFMLENKIHIMWSMHGYGISDSHNLRFSWIDKYPNVDWCWDFGIPNNKYLDITKENIIKYGLDKIISKAYINPFSNNVNLTLEIIEMFPKSIWDFKELSENPNFQIEWINKFPEAKWNLHELSKNPNFQIEWINKFSEAKWNLHELSKNPNFQIEWINKFPDAIRGYKKWMMEYPKDKWDFKQISKNKNLNIEWINKFPKERMWHPKPLFEKMFYEEKVIVYRRYLAAYKIQQWWHNITLSPEYVVGRKFINRKYDDLFKK